MIHILIQNTGAQRGLFITIPDSNEDGTINPQSPEFIIQVMGEVGKEEVEAKSICISFSFSFISFSWY